MKTAMIRIITIMCIALLLHANSLQQKQSFTVTHIAMDIDKQSKDVHQAINNIVEDENKTKKGGNLQK